MDANDRIACLLSSAAKRYPPVAFAVRRDGGEPGCQHASFALALVPGDDKPVGAPHQVRLESEAGSVADLDRRSAELSSCIKPLQVNRRAPPRAAMPRDERPIRSDGQ